MEQEYEFKLTMEESNKIVGALAGLPYRESYGLINKLQAQFSNQTVAESDPQEQVLNEQEQVLNEQEQVLNEQEQE